MEVASKEIVKLSEKVKIMNENMPLVSVIIPCYNHEKYVEQTIESIVNQSYKNIELIVIDDGSKDKSTEVLQKLNQRYGFYFEYQENIGLSATLNKALKVCKGKYISICASDDKYTLDKIEKQVQLMEQNVEYGMCYSNVYTFTDDGKISSQKLKKSKSGWIFNEIFYADFFMQAVSCFYKKSVLLELDGFDENLKVEDTDLHLRLTNKYPVGYSDDFLAYYRVHAGNTISNRMMILQEVIKILDKWKYNPGYKYAKSKHLVMHFNVLAVEDKKEALRIFPSIVFFLLKEGLWKSIVLLLLPKKIIYFINNSRNKNDSN